MRVIHASAYFAPAYVYGGPPRSIFGLCRALRAGGVDAVAFTTNANGDGELPATVTTGAEFEGVPVRYFPRSWPREPIGSRALQAALRSELRSADLLHVHGLWNRVVWAAAREARRAGIPYVLSPRGMLEPSALGHHSLRKRLAWTLIERATVAGAALLHATSEQEYQTLRARHPGTEVVLAPNGVELPAAAAASARRPMVAFIGRIHAIKRLDLLIDAFVALRISGRRASLAIAGPDEGRLQATLSARAGEFARDVEWRGEIDGEQRGALLAEASAVVMCSDSESFGLSAAEAMAAGVPVVVTRTCPWAEVERAGAGYWVEQRPDAIARALEAILRDPIGAREMGARGRALIEQKYQWPVVAAELARHYTRLTDARSTRMPAVAL
jgi:glycosyltransferase involved in cell wall biosynthesis